MFAKRVEGRHSRHFIHVLGAVEKFSFFPKALRAGFSFRFRGPGVGHAVDGCRRPCGAPKRAFRSRGSEIRLGGPGRISELRRQGLSEGPNGVSKRHWE